MITRQDNPPAWDRWMNELEDAHEHLGTLVQEMQHSGHIGFEDFSIDMAHIYAHLNRAWRFRDLPGEVLESEWDALREFPKDLEPMA